MNKKIQEIKNQIEVLKAEARQLVDEDKLKEAKNKTDEIKELKNKLDMLTEIEELEAQNTTGKQIGEIKDEKEQEQLYKNAFIKALKGKRLSIEDREIIENALTESTDEDGALIVPKDIKTQINEFKRSLVDISQLATIEPVSTLTGSRVLEKIATMTTLENITDDTADIPEMQSPKFDQVTYSIKKYAGWLPIPNDLLKDSDQNIINYLKKWIAKKSVVTNNTLFLAIISMLNEVIFADYKDIKKALNVKLDPMHALNAKILTNQDGFHYLDTLEDKTGKPLLQTDIVNPTKKLFAGKEIQIAPNSILKTTTDGENQYAPIHVGDFKETVIKFDRQTYEIASTNVGGTAFRKDRTEMRVIEREEYKSWDTDAVVRGKIDVSSVI